MRIIDILDEFRLELAKGMTVGASFMSIQQSYYMKLMEKYNEVSLTEKKTNITEKEFLEEFICYLDHDFDASWLNGKIDSYLQTHHKEYYEVEFIRKEEKEEWQEKGGDNLC